ncbi:probable inactive linolenate hydroperoxide lyase [Elaeis guineensis]|uniref:Probable inactive linolenate hydroperoxide lyase n=1 Tax=Elaeis guineensis var. tenera TaxID=51953 RepID=A0A6I9RP71_ELAGV|nr:probable inactive linolenate hydroperoxide lyase [Elaeis guineensis]
MLSTMSMMMRPSCSSATTPLPARPIPGSYGLPLIGPLKDRLDYFWFQGPETFFRSRMATHKGTVFRTNMPPTFPFFVGVNPHVVALLDCSSFSTLFDPSLVDKRNVLVGDYMPSLAFTGNTRVVVYLDPSEPDHSRVKSFCLDLLKSSAKVWVSEFLRNLDLMLASIESDVAKNGSASFFLPLQKCIFSFLANSLVGADPSASPDVGDLGFVLLDKWLALQLLPITKVGVIPQPLEELLLHSFPFPFFLVSGAYRKLYDFVEKGGQEVIQRAEKDYGLKKEEAIHNILFVLGFNAFGGFSVFLPSLITTIGTDKTGLQEKLREEVRRVMQSRGESVMSFQAVREMELVRSTVYEVLRLKPPVPLQFGRARTDFELKSHECSYRVEKGELLCGYQPLVMRDPLVFDRPEDFLPDRFLGSAGRELLNYLFWSNGPETGTPTTANKQCAAKDYVIETACLLVAEIFNRYDEFLCDESTNVTKLVKK